MKKVLLLLMSLFVSCSHQQILTKDEVIKYIKQHYTSKTELTPSTLINFKTNNFNNDNAKEEIKLLALYGYEIELNDALNGEKKINNKDEFIHFYGQPFVPLNENAIESFTGNITYQLNGDELQIKTIEQVNNGTDEKIFYYLNNGYEKRRIEIFKRATVNYNYMVTITSTYSY